MIDRPGRGRHRAAAADGRADLPDDAGAVRRRLRRPQPDPHRPRRRPVGRAGRRLRPRHAVDGLPRPAAHRLGPAGAHPLAASVRFAAITPVHAEPTCTGTGHVIDESTASGSPPLDLRRHPRRRHRRPSPATPSSPSTDEGKEPTWESWTARSRSSPAPAAASAARSRSSSRREGASVVVNDLDAGPAKETVAAIEAAGGQAVACVGQRHRRRTSPSGSSQTAVDAFGGLDIIVNNAGYTWDSVIQKMTDEQWDAILDVHLQGAVPDPARGPAGHRRGGQGRGRGGPEVLPQGRQHLLDRRARRQRRPGQLRRGQGRRHRPDQDAGQGVGPLQRHRQRGRVRLHQDPAHRGPRRRRRHHRRRGPARSRSASTRSCSPRWSR